MKYRKEEKHTLYWHTYTDHLREMFHEMLKTSELADVTLVSDDLRQFKAHKIVISACSAVFKQILKDLPQNSSVIYLRGIQHQEMESILQFMYLGETTFDQERMNELFNVAKNLEIKDLNANVELVDTRNEEEIQDKESDDEENNAEPIPQQINAPSEVKKDLEIRESNSSFEFSEDIKDKQNLKVEKPNLTIQKKVTNFSCEHCDFQATRKANLKVHIESKHEGVKWACNQCPYQASYQGNLWEHKRGVHMGLKKEAKYTCSLCDYRATIKSNLLIHMQSKHESAVQDKIEKFQCEHCDFQTTRKPYLKVHIGAQHLGVRYPCNECGFQFKGQSHLIAHKRTVHEGLRFSCDQCDFSATRKDIIRNHIQSKHYTV